MSETATEADFIEEVSDFLNATDISRPYVGSERAGAGTSTSSSDRGRSPNDSQVSKHLTSRQKQVLRKKRYERRLKNERNTLRDTVSALTSRLEQLQRGSSSTQWKALVSSARNCTTWKALVTLKREERYKADKEKLRLEAAIDEQATYIAILRELLPKNVYDWVALTAETRAAIVSSRQANMQANCVLFGEHLRQVLAAYSQLDEILREIHGLDGITATLCRSTTVNGDEYFRHFNNYTVPFSFKQTSDAWWQITNLNQWLQEGDGYAKLADPNDTVILRVRLARTLPTGMTVSVLQRYILRRFVDETRAVFMWKTFSEGEGTFAGAYIEETGWTRLQPSTEDESTVISVCVHQVPMHVGGAVSSSADIQGFYDVMRSLLKENAQVMMSLLTKKLLEETLSTIDVD